MNNLIRSGRDRASERDNDRVLLVVFGGGGGLGSFYLSRGKALEAVGGMAPGAVPDCHGRPRHFSNKSNDIIVS